MITLHVLKTLQMVGRRLQLQILIGLIQVFRSFWEHFLCHEIIWMWIFILIWWPVLPKKGWKLFEVLIWWTVLLKEEWKLFEALIWWIVLLKEGWYCLRLINTCFFLIAQTRICYEVKVRDARYLCHIRFDIVFKLVYSQHSIDI